MWRKSRIVALALALLLALAPARRGRDARPRRRRRRPAQAIDYVACVGCIVFMPLAVPASVFYTTLVCATRS